MEVSRQLKQIQTFLPNGWNLRSVLRRPDKAVMVMVRNLRSKVCYRLIFRLHDSIDFCDVVVASLISDAFAVLVV